MASPGAITHNALDVKVAHSQIPTKFVVSVPDAQLRDLKERLSRTRYLDAYTVPLLDVDVIESLNFCLGACRWPDQLEGVGWEYGTELAYTKVCRDTGENDAKYVCSRLALHTTHGTLRMLSRGGVHACASIHLQVLMTAQHPKCHRSIP